MTQGQEATRHTFTDAAAVQLVWIGWAETLLEKQYPRLARRTDDGATLGMTCVAQRPKNQNMIQPENSLLHQLNSKSVDRTIEGERERRREREDVTPTSIFGVSRDNDYPTFCVYEWASRGPHTYVPRL